MSNLKILVWREGEPRGEPDVEVKIPATLAKWVPRMMALVPKKTKAEVWGDEADFKNMFANIEELIKEATERGVLELMDVKTKEGHVKVLIER